jgi:two-component system sensor kinase FixL
LLSSALLRGSRLSATIAGEIPGSKGSAGTNLDEKVKFESDMGLDAAAYRRLVEAAPDAVIVADHEGTIVLVNEQAESLFDYSREELIGEAVELLIPERLREGHVGRRDGFAANPHVRPMGAGLELFGRGRSGREFPVEISISPVHTGTRHLVAAAIRDITDRRRMERELRRANIELGRSNEELEQFAYVASHDLQEPLRKIQAFGDLLRLEHAPALVEEAREYIEIMQGAAARMQKLINDLLAFSRVSSQASPFVAVDLSQTVAEVVSDLEPTIEESGARVECERLPSLQADPVQMRALFQNLLSNAVKYRRDGVVPHVRIYARNDGKDHCQIVVEDNGIGFETKHAEKIFRVFQRLHGRNKFAGTGIGLAICQRIVNRHRGTISARGVPGEGAVFTVTLPERQAFEETSQ